MKRQLSFILALLLTLAMILSSCGTYSPAGGGSQGDGSSDTSDGGENTGETNEDLFTVSLRYNGETYIPSPDKEIYAQWNDGFSFHKAKLGEDGVARIGGLDGDYRVTLSDIPEGYGYDPNVYTATNNQKQIVIELYKLVDTTGRGQSLYNCISLRSTGVYCVELDSQKDEVFFEFAPRKSGTYSVHSWTDTVANAVNPKANYYGANAFFKKLEFVANDGGAESSFTKNFKLDVKIADEMIGANGQVTFTFGITADSKSEQYPVKVYFVIMLDGDFSLSHTESSLIVPSERLVHQPSYDPSRYTFVGAEIPQTVNGNTANIFDGDAYQLWSRADGGDGYYHLYNEEKYPETHGYGPILYAFVSAPCRFMDASFNTVEMRGNKALTVSNGTENYKLFIEGFSALLEDPPGDNGPYFCVTNCPCRLGNQCESSKTHGYVGACTDACTNCHIDCRRCPEEAMGKSGYADYCNSDGVYGVTQELKDFLQKYSISQLLFFDGNGFVETNPAISVYAEEDDQWLFACGYYVEK